MLTRRCVFAQQDSEAASDSKHLETLLSGTHGHAEKEHGPALLEGMVAWLVARMAEPSAHVKFKTVTVLLVLGRQGPGSWFGVCKANDGLAPLLTELSEYVPPPPPPSARPDCPPASAHLPLRLFPTFPLSVSHPLTDSVCLLTLGCLRCVVHRFQSEEAERAAHGIRKSSKDLLEAMK
eukprot:COSAG04_NODE_918_length_9425_cov_1.980270_12_plen_179_part_00